MVIDTVLYAKIRKYKNNGASMRYAADALGISRKTIKRYWDGAHTPDERKAYPPVNDSPEKLAIIEALKKYFEDNKNLSMGKQTINAQTAWKAIRDTYQVGESTVRRYVRELKEENPQAFIPLDFEPGECVQFDWCEVKICIKGHIWKAPVFCAVLPYSYDIFAMILPNAQWSCFLAGHVAAFNHFQGVPERAFYDNLKSAVLQDYGKNAVKQERFKALEAHYGFEASFMNKSSGNEKGAVENLCGSIRHIAFTPIPKGDTLEEIQELVTRRCLEYREFHKVRERPRPVLEMFREERPCLQGLPAKPYEACDTLEAVVYSDMTFLYEKTHYSLPIEYTGKTVTLRIFPYVIEAWYKGALAYRHVRPFVKGENRYIPEHYLPLLVLRPRAVRNAAPLKFGVLPPELEKFREKCTAKDKLEQLANILLLARDTDSALLLAAVDYANKTGVPTLGKVKLYLETKKSQRDTIATDPVIVQQQELDQYDILLGAKEDTDVWLSSGNIEDC